MNGKILIVIADDNLRFRKALAQTLIADPFLDVVGQGATAKEATRLTCDLCPDILLLDIHMPGGGLNSARTVRRTCPATKVLVLSASQEYEIVQEAFRVGVYAYILKGVRGSELVRLIHGIWDGKPLMSPHLLLEV